MRCPSTLSRMVMLLHFGLNSTSSHWNNSSSPRRAPVISKACKYALITGLAIFRTASNQIRMVHPALRLYLLCGSACAP